MIPIDTIDFISIEEVKSNPNKYKEVYFRDKIIVFRNANLSKEQQEDLMVFFGDLFGWFPNSKDSTVIGYTEDHHKHMKGDVYATKEDLMLAWHTEHVQNEEDPHIGATWRMEKFECPEDSGHTYFVDMTKMFEDLSKEDQNFLSKCVNKVNTTEFRDTDKGIVGIKISKEFDLVKSHPATGEKTIRLSLFAKDGELNTLSKFDGREPNKEEKDIYRRLVSFICTQVWTNRDIRMVLRWKQGDLAVPDLFKLAHAVSGGFIENQRTLKGEFGKLLPWVYSYGTEKAEIK
jgi:alpha-ketoglutarate-dependent taurine dioxygenase